MGREDVRKRSGGVADRRRAHAYLGQLEWLELLDGSWRHPETGEPLELDGAAIASTRRAARTVLREHRSVLPKLVGDVDAWWAIVDAKLAWCSACAGGRDAGFDPRPFLPPRTARLLEAARARELAWGAAVAWVGRPATLERALAWFASHEGALAELPVEPDERWRIAMLFARWVIREESGDTAERAVDELLALLALDGPEPRAALADIARLDHQLRGLQPRTSPSMPRSAKRILAWLPKLAAHDQRVRRRTFELLAQARIAEALRPWVAWEREHASLFARADELIHSAFADDDDKAPHVARVVGRLEAAARAAPIPAGLTDAILDIDMLACGSFDRIHPAIVRLLAALPAALGPSGRARMLLHCSRTAACAGDTRVDLVWDAFAAAFERGAPPELLAPLRAALTGDARSWFEDDLAGFLAKPAEATRVVRVMIDLAKRDTGVQSDDAFRVAALLRGGFADEAIVADVALALRGADGRLETELARVVAVLAGGSSADKIASAARQLMTATSEMTRGQEKKLLALVEHAVATGGEWILRGELEAGRGAGLASLLAVVPASRARMPPLVTERPAPWIARYPKVLEPSLRRLAGVDPDAEATAARRLQTDLPDPAALRREIAALRERPGLAKRLATLEARLAAPKSPSAVRLARLATKLERAAREIGLARFRAALTAAATDRIRRTFGLAAWPEWADRPAVLAVLFALLDLDDPHRRLAGRLLQARCGQPPWDLREDPTNRAYLDKMRRAGIDPAPWLDETVRDVTPAKGKPITLALTSDPLDVFQMGAHFETCLAPSGGNFFSVVANAADINKRVLYARRGTSVVGRCLFALTDGFALLVFHAYCHDGELDFDDIVREHALDLARRMNTTVVPRGSVRKLLAHDWYDDGPRDLVGRFKGLDDAALDFATIEPERLVPALRAALQRDLDDVTLPIVLEHAGVRNRPALVYPLAPSILASSVPRTRVAAARLAFDCDVPAHRAGDAGRDARAARRVEPPPRGPSRDVAALPVRRRRRHQGCRHGRRDGVRLVRLHGTAARLVLRPRTLRPGRRLGARQLLLHELDGLGDQEAQPRQVK